MGAKKQRNPRGVSVRKDTGRIYISFMFKGVRCREPLSIPNTRANINYASRLLGEIQNKIERGTFYYAEYFPKSNKVALFGKISGDYTVKQYLDDYLNDCKNRGLSPSTINGYVKIVNQLKHFHEITAVKLTPLMIKNWIKDQAITAKTVRNRLSLLRSALDEAVTDEIIPVNPVNKVTVGRYTSTTKKNYKVDPLTPEEIELVLNSCKSDEHKYLFMFAFHTGLRSSELCALQWSDVNLNTKVIHVHQAKVNGVIKGTKTKAGTRDVDLDDEAIYALNHIKRYQQHNFVFPDPKTRSKVWANADAIRKKAWIPALEKSGIRYRNAYQTRHTFATMKISQGVNLFYLAKQMGHKGLEMIFQNYGDYLKEYDGNTVPKK